jgi:hypothetical protein
MYRMERAAGALALAAGAALFGALLARLRRFELAHAAALPWWFGYARDGANLLGASIYIGGFALAGLPGPPALVAGVALVIAHYVADWALGRRLALRRAPALLALAIAAGGAALALAAGRVGGALWRAIDAAAPR